MVTVTTAYLNQIASLCFVVHINWEALWWYSNLTTGACWIYCWGKSAKLKQQTCTSGNRNLQIGQNPTEAFRLTSGVITRKLSNLNAHDAKQIGDARAMLVYDSDDIKQRNKHSRQEPPGRAVLRRIIANNHETRSRSDVEKHRN